MNVLSNLAHQKDKIDQQIKSSFKALSNIIPIHSPSRKTISEEEKKKDYDSSIKEIDDEEDEDYVDADFEISSRENTHY